MKTLPIPLPVTQRAQSSPLRNHPPITLPELYRRDMWVEVRGCGLSLDANVSSPPAAPPYDPVEAQADVGLTGLTVTGAPP